MTTLLRAAFVALFLASCSTPAPEAPPPPKVTVVHPLSREITEWDDYTARIEAVESVEVRPRVSGYLQSVAFQDGSIVKKGDLLFIIDPRPYEATLRHAQADLGLARTRLELTERNFARAGGLLASHAISQEEFDIRQSTARQAEASLQVAQAAVDAARLDVEFTRLTAPITGRVGRKLVTEGNLVVGGAGAQSTLLTTIVSSDPVYAYFDADERLYLKYVRLAQSGERPSSRDFHNPAWIGVADEIGFPREGRMDFVDNQIDHGTGTMVGRAIIPNPDQVLTPGLFARLRIPGSGKYTAMMIPDEAIGSDQAQKFVWIVNADNTTEHRQIQTGSLIDGLRVVRSGLTTDDTIIVGGIQRARPGEKVDPQREQPPVP